MKNFWKQLFAKQAPAAAAPMVAPTFASNTEPPRAAPQQGARPKDDPGGKLADEAAVALTDAAIVDGSLLDANYVFLPSDEAPEEDRQRAIKGMEGAGRRDIAETIRKYGYRRMRFALTARDTFSGVPLDAISPIQAGQAVEVIERALSVPLPAWRNSSADSRSKFFRHAVEEAARWCLSVGRETDAASLYALIVELRLEAMNLPNGTLYGPGRARDAEPSAVPAVGGAAREVDGGDLEALFGRAMRLRAEPKSPQSEAEILRLLTTAAQADHVQAKGVLGETLRDRGDFQAAASWLRSAAESGDGRAWVPLGMVYLNSLGDSSKAQECFETGSRAGDGMALANLGIMYANGVGVQKNPCKAALLLLAATGCGNEPAEAFLKEVLPRVGAAPPEQLRKLNAVMGEMNTMVMAKEDHTRIATFVIERLETLDD